ncbi:hypothetical protein HF563_01420, partial [Acidithiobacillus ferridurans]|nr:hypothetical protein [Acidithiobacillus ferridurans]
MFLAAFGVDPVYRQFQDLIAIHGEHHDTSTPPPQVLLPSDKSAHGQAVFSPATVQSRQQRDNRRVFQPQPQPQAK